MSITGRIWQSKLSVTSRQLSSPCVDVDAIDEGVDHSAGRFKVHFAVGDLGQILEPLIGPAAEFRFGVSVLTGLESCLNLSSG